MRKVLLCLGALSAAAVLTTGGAGAQSIRSQRPARQAESGGAKRAVSLAQIEAGIQRRVNEIRSRSGLPPLRANKRLAQVARDYSRAMSVEGFFEHTDPAGNDARDRVCSAGIDFAVLGENLCECENVRDPAEEAVRGWMKSPAHRKNILLKGVTETGIGVWKKGKTYHITQLFLRPA